MCLSCKEPTIKNVMRISSLLPLTLLLIYTPGYSQSKKTSYLSFSIAPSFAIGKYAQKDATKSSSGFASAGESANISYDHLTNSRFGWSVALHGQRNPLNIKALANAMSQFGFYEGFYVSSSPNPVPPQSQATKYGNWKFDNNSWWLGSLLLGGNVETRGEGSNKFSFTAKLMIGAVYASAPEIKGKSTSDTAIAQIKQTGATGFGFAYTINSGIKFKLNNRVYFLTQLEYFGTSNITFKDVQITFASAHYSNGFPTSASSQTATGNAKQTIASVNLNVGIGINLK
jgi:hypothetical protein